MEFVSAIWYGWLVGVGISILLFGPAFFLLVNTSIKEGFNRGVLLSLGVFTSDLVLVLLIHFGLNSFYDKVIFQFIFGIVAGTAMLIWGIKTMRGKYRNFLSDMHLPSSKKGSWFTGFLMNIFNPFAFVLWTTTLANVGSHFDPDEKHYTTKVMVSALSMLFGLLCMDVFKAFTFNRLGKFIPQRRFFKIQFLIGIILTSAGVYFIAKAIRLIVLNI